MGSRENETALFRFLTFKPPEDTGGPVLCYLLQFSLPVRIVTIFLMFFFPTDESFELLREVSHVFASGVLSQNIKLCDANFHETFPCL